MPLYTTAGTAHALDLPQKWLDNLLSHNKIDGIQQARQGVPRRVSIEAILTIALTRELSEQASLPTPAALAIAERLVASQTGHLQLTDQITITADLTTLRRQTLAKLAQVVESTPIRTRGRPKGS